MRPHVAGGGALGWPVGSARSQVSLKPERAGEENQDLAMQAQEDPSVVLAPKDQEPWGARLLELEGGDGSVEPPGGPAPLAPGL